MRRLSLLFSVLFVLPLFGYDSPKEYDGTMAEVGIEGTWQEVEYSHNGQKVDGLRDGVLTLGHGTYTMIWTDGDTRQGVYSIDSTRKPPRLNHIPSHGVLQGKTVKSIYQIYGDSLRIAFIAKVPDGRRPQGFNDVDVWIYTYRRAK